MQTNLNLKLSATEESLSISGDIFYSSITNMYIIDGVLKDGEGLQVDKGTDEAKARVLCRTIAKAVKQYLEK